MINRPISPEKMTEISMEIDKRICGAYTSIELAQQLRQVAKEIRSGDFSWQCHDHCEPGSIRKLMTWRELNSDDYDD